MGEAHNGTSILILMFSSSPEELAGTARRGLGDCNGKGLTADVSSLIPGLSLALHSAFRKAA